MNLTRWSNIVFNSSGLDSNILADSEYVFIDREDDTVYRGIATYSQEEAAKKADKTAVSFRLQ